jgi:hypothetical protein
MPVLLWHVQDAIGERDAGVVHEDMNPTVFRSGILHQSACLIGGRNVDNSRVNGARARVGSDSGKAIRVATRRQDVSALSRKGEHGRTPDSTGAPSYDHILTTEAH